MQYLTMDIGGSSIKYALARDNLQLTEKGELPTQYDTHATFVETLGGVYDRFAGRPIAKQLPDLSTSAAAASPIDD